MMKNLLLTLLLSALSAFNTASAFSPSKTDVIQCGIDAGTRQGVERSAFVEGCLTVKYAAQEARGNNSNADSRKARSGNCEKLAEKKQGAERKAFIDGCSKANKDL